MKEIIKRALEEAQISQKELAEKIHVTPQAVSKWVRGEAEPSRDNIVEIGNTLGREIAEKLFRKGLKDRENMKKEPTELKDLNNIDKAYAETKNILDGSGVQNYSHAVYKLLTWLVTAVIGLTYHRYIHNKDKEEGTIYEDIFFYLNDLVEDNGKTIEEHFYLMGGDLFESWGDYKLKNHDYAREAEDLWYKFKKGLDRYEESSLLHEFKVALIDIINENSCY